MHQRTPTGGTAGPLSLFVIPRACEGNATSGTDPADTHDDPPPPNLKLSREADTCNDGVMLHVVTDSQYAVL